MSDSASTENFQSGKRGPSQNRQRAHSAGHTHEWIVCDSVNDSSNNKRKKLTLKSAEEKKVQPMDSNDSSEMPPPPSNPAIVASVKVQNQYARLSDCDDDESVKSVPPFRNRAVRNEKKPASGSAYPSSHTRPLKPVANASGPKLPAITITEPPTKELYAIIDKVSKNHTFHARSGELKIFPSTVEYHCNITENLSKLNVPYFTHPIKGEARFKSVLFGIPHMRIEYIWQQLAAHKIKPVSVDYLLTKDEREKNVSISALADHDSNRLRSYVLEFASASVKREEVHSIKYINRHVCSWRNFKTGGNGPTLCNRCCMFGHGQRGCGRVPVCSLCAEAHLSSSCPLASRTDSKAKHRCINCTNNKLNFQHCASSLDCPSRELYINRRKTANEARNKFSSASTALSARNAIHKSLPGTGGTHKQPRTNILSSSSSSKLQITKSAATSSMSYAEAVSGPRKKATLSRMNTQALFTLDECADLLFNAIEELQLCQTKLDQMKVLTGLLSKCLV